MAKKSDIVKAYNKEIMDLPYISSANPRKIRNFSKKLNYCIQALESMKQLNKVNGKVPMTLAKLPEIRGDLVRTDSDWKNWHFTQLVQAVKQGYF